MRRVPLIKADLPNFEEVESSFREILANGRITNFGLYVQQLEKEAGEFLGVPVVTTSSGTMGTLFALQAWGIRPGDKVIVPSFTFTASVQAILYAGATPVFAEVRDDLTLDVDDLDSLLAAHPEATAVMPVHVYGLPCQVADIASIADKHAQRLGRPIRILYDAAHAFGASADGTRVGGFGDAEIFSLSVTKALVCVEGGMVASHEEATMQRIRYMRNYGIESNYNATEPGLNGKMSEFHAIVGLANLRRLPDILATRKEKALAFRRLIEEKTSLAPIALPENVEHTFKDFVVVLPKGKAAQRDALRAYLGEAGIETRAYFYPPIHQQSYFTKLQDRDLPRTDDLASRVLTLPFYTTITFDDIEYVVDHLVKAETSVL
ncbi:MAG: DegT/DnrJ/EryC1/StrS family aminotransferase [Planctomycetales bacterium]|nr:DegT/DnrJ/EryC1/StrS family aminotransferase [Planctomycetales bacterium]